MPENRSLHAPPEDAAPPRRPSVIVVSHERSGTHFLINSLMKAYGYPSPFLSFDYLSLDIDYRNPAVVAGVLGKVGASPRASVVKSHHAAGFFNGILDRVLDRTPILYIHRDPVDVMISFWRYARHWMPREMAHAHTVTDFALGPTGVTLARYQTAPCRDLLERWARHVDEWLDAAATRPRIVVVRYDDLRDHYAETMAGLAPLLGPLTGVLDPPDRETNVVKGAAADRLPAPDRIALRALALTRVGDTMRRLGYA